MDYAPAKPPIDLVGFTPESAVLRQVTALGKPAGPALAHDTDPVALRHLATAINHLPVAFPAAVSACIEDVTPSTRLPELVLAPSARARQSFRLIAGCDGLAVRVGAEREAPVHVPQAAERSAKALFHYLLRRGR